MRTAKTTAEASFWDTSGLILLATTQRDSRRAHTIRRGTGPIVLWWGSRVEASSALARLAREGALDADRVAEAEARMEALERGSMLIQPSEAVRERARLLVHAHPLRAGDALQLAAALLAVGNRPAGRVLVTFDVRLASVARAVGFEVRP